MSNVVLVCGFPASGKSSLSKKYIDQGYVHVNRDKIGGRVRELVPMVETLLKEGKDIVLDNVFSTIEEREPFIEAVNAAGETISCEWMSTPVEDCSINALHRMWDRYGQVFMTAQEIKDHDKASKDSNMFPIVVLFKFKKEWEDPTVEEGFSTVTKHKFKRDQYVGTDKAVIFDYDDTLRTSVGDEKYPVKESDIKILDGRKEKLQQLAYDGYLLLGVSNQSGIARGKLTEEDAQDCFEHTSQLLEIYVDYRYCPHNVPPSCYCRKPQSGLGVQLIREHDLNVRDCIYVGDQTTDKTFAKRLGFKYYDAEEFFAKDFVLDKV